MRFAALIAGVLAFLVAGEEAAAKRVAVLDFRGPRAGQFQRAIARYVADRHALIRPARYNRAARRMGARSRNRRNIRRVARRLNIDAVVIGSVSRRRGRFQLTVRVRAGKTGRFIGPPIQISSRAPRIVGRNRRKVKSQLFRALRRAPVLRGGGREGEDEASERREEAEVEEEFIEEGEGEREMERERERESIEETEEEQEEPVRVAEREETSEAKEEKKAPPAPEAPLSAERRADLEARSRAVELEGGIAGIVRNLGFNAAQGLGDDAPQGYQGGFVPAVFLSAELYPLAFDLKNGGFSRNLGLSAVFERVLTIKSRVPNMPNLALPTTQQRFGIGAVYRHNFGSSPTSPTLKVSVHYSQASFTIDRTPAEEMGITIDVPNVTYAYYDPGLVFRYPLSEELALAAHGRYLFVTSTGEMQQNDSYGSASVTGFDLGAYAEYRFKPRLLLRAGGKATRFAFDFDGSGALTDRNGDMTQDVGGALDDYLTAYATLGYLF